jgi:hypothetical protein
VRRFFWEGGLGTNILKVAWSVTRISFLGLDRKIPLLGAEGESREDLTEVLQKTEYFSSDTLA